MKNDNEYTLAQILEEFDEDYCVGYENRRLAEEDMRFSCVQGGQWEGFLEDIYQDRTKIEMDMVNIAVERFVGEYADNRVDVKYSPLGATNDEDAELLQGIYRRDFRRGRGKISNLSAIAEMARCGVGAIQLHAVYEDDESDEDDLQKIEFRYIPNAYKTVVFDCNAKEIDKADAMRGVRLYEYSVKEFKKEYPDKSVSTVQHDDYYYDSQFEWYGKDVLYVGHRYDVEVKKLKVYTFINPETEAVQKVAEDDLELVEGDLIKRGWEKISRKLVTKRSIYKTVFSGAEILEPRRKISGSIIPIIPFYCYRAFVNGREVFWGLIRKMKDAQRLYNMEISQAAEISSNGNRDIPIIDPRATKGYEQYWEQGNIYDNQYLPAVPELDPTTGQVIQPVVGSIPAARMTETSAAVMEAVSSYIKETTGGQEADITDVDLSGKAILALTKRMNLNTRSVSMNIELSTQRLGDAYRSMAGDVYDVHRVIGLLAEDGTESTARLREMVIDDKGQIVEKNNIKKMRFEATSSVGAAFETQRNETVETLRSLITESQGNPTATEYLPVLYASLLDNISGTGLDPVKKFNRKKMLALGLIKPESEEDAAYLQQISQQNDPQADLMAAAANQQNAEAENLKAQAIERVSKTELNRAKAVEAIENIKTKRIEILRNAISNPAA